MTPDLAYGHDKLGKLYMLVKLTKMLIQEQISILILNEEIIQSGIQRIQMVTLGMK